MEEYFQAKRELLGEGNTYGDMMAAYPAYWSGLRSGELVVLMDVRVLGRVWQGQIMGQDPQIEEWTADAAPNMGALQQLFPLWTTSEPCGRKYGFSTGVRAEASKKRGTLVKTPLG